MSRPLAFFTSLWLFSLGTPVFADWTSEINIKSLNFPETISSETNNNLVITDLKLEGEFHFKNNFDLVTKMDYRADPVNKSIEERNFFDLPDDYLKWHNDLFLVKLGTQIYAWGVTDGDNPIDLVNTRNYYDALHSTKLGALSASLNLTKDWFEGELIWEPKARPSQLPGTNSRWLPRSVYVPPGGATYNGKPFELELPSEILYHYNNLDELPYALENNYAARLQFHPTGIDLAFYFYDGVAPFPIVNPVVNGTVKQVSPIQIIQVSPGVELDIQQYRQTSSGFSFVKTLESWQLKGETVWTQPESDPAQIYGWSHESVLALEKSWTPTESSSLMTVLQYSFNRHQNLGGNDLTSPSYFFNDNWMLGLHGSWHENHTFTLFFSHDTIYNSNLVDFNYELRLRDNLKVGVAASTISGPPTSPLGAYTKNTELSAYADLTIF